MASSSFMAFLAMFLLINLPMAAIGGAVPPVLSPFFDNICDDVECGRGSCEAAAGSPFNFICRCDAGWKRTRLDNETNLQFLPCIIPNCTLDYSCMPAAPPTPSIPYNLSFFDPCYWIYCGEGTCDNRSKHKHACRCNPGYSNLLNITAFPCYSQCAIGTDCERLGVRLSNSTSSSSEDSNQATSFLPGKSHWLAVLLASAAMVLWNGL